MNLQVSTYLAPNTWDFVSDNFGPPIFRLPEEILTYIFEFLDTFSLLQTGYVCHKWRKLSTDDQIWKIREINQLFPNVTVIPEEKFDIFIGMHFLDTSEKLSVKKNQQYIIRIFRAFKERTTLALDNTLLKDKFEFVKFNKIIDRKYFKILKLETEMGYKFVYVTDTNLMESLRY